MDFILGFFVGSLTPAAVVVGYLWLTRSKPSSPAVRFLPRGRRSYPRHIDRPDVRRIIMRPVNKDEPPSRITQALFRQRPTRKLEDNARDD